MVNVRTVVSSLPRFMSMHRSVANSPHVGLQPAAKGVLVQNGYLLDPVDCLGSELTLLRGTEAQPVLAVWQALPCFTLAAHEFRMRRAELINLIIQGGEKLGPRLGKTLVQNWKKKTKNRLSILSKSRFQLDMNGLSTIRLFFSTTIRLIIF